MKRTCNTLESVLGFVTFLQTVLQYVFGAIVVLGSVWLVGLAVAAEGTAVGRIPGPVDAKEVLEPLGAHLANARLGHEVDRHYEAD